MKSVYSPPTCRRRVAGSFVLILPFFILLHSSPSLSAQTRYYFKVSDGAKTNIASGILISNADVTSLSFTTNASGEIWAAIDLAATGSGAGITNGQHNVALGTNLTVNGQTPLYDASAFLSAGSTNLSDFNNDVPFLTAESDPVFATWSNTFHATVANQPATNSLFQQAIDALASTNTVFQGLFDAQALTNANFSTAIAARYLASNPSNFVGVTINGTAQDGFARFHFRSNLTVTVSGNSNIVDAASSGGSGGGLGAYWQTWGDPEAFVNSTNIAGFQAYRLSTADHDLPAIGIVTFATNTLHDRYLEWYVEPSNTGRTWATPAFKVDWFADLTNSANAVIPIGGIVIYGVQKASQFGAITNSSTIIYTNATAINAAASLTPETITVNSNQLFNGAMFPAYVIRIAPQVLATNVANQSGVWFVKGSGKLGLQ